MPGNTPPRTSTRWEGTHTYKIPEAAKRKARTVAQLREEAAAKSKASREEAVRKRRGSIGGPDLEELASTATKNNKKIAAQRRGSTGGITPPPSAPGTPGPTASGSERREDATTMPGSGKKKRNTSGQGGDGGEGVDPALLKFLTTMKQDLMESTREAVGRIETKLERHESSIAALERRVDEGEKNLAARISSEVAKQCTKAGPTIPQGTPTKREAAYHFCRRSLKLWPIEGPQIEDAVRNFLKVKLKLSDARIRAIGTIEASELPGRLAKERREILATFETREDRDSIKACGINLAGQREVGMSIHVPGHLMDNLIALNGVGYSIKQKNSDVKRSVKFDDQKQDLYLDICIGGRWRRISPSEAKQALKDVPTASTVSGASITVEELTDLIKGKEKEDEDADVVVIHDDNMET